MKEDLENLRKEFKKLDTAFTYVFSEIEKAMSYLDELDKLEDSIEKKYKIENQKDEILKQIKKDKE
jgi:hypothetical protein